jgi:hemolysin III
MVSTFMQSDGRPSGLSWNYDREELLADGVVHTIGVGLALIGAVLLIVVSGDSTQVVKTASVLIYAAGLLTMLGISAAYNMWPASPRKWLLRRFDHSAIYLLIAATYTPFIAQMKAEIATVGLLLAVWCFAIVGIALKLALPGRLDRLSIGLYLLLGWSGMMAYEPVAPHCRDQPYGCSRPAACYTR